MEYEPHNPRGPKTPPPGMRPAPPSEVAGPQATAATVGYVAAGAPLAVVPSLVGGHHCRDPPPAALKKKKKKKKKREEEKEERRLQLEEAEHERRELVLDRRVSANEQLTPDESYGWRASAGHLPEKRRKKKKRRKGFPNPRPLGNLDSLLFWVMFGVDVLLEEYVLRCMGPQWIHPHDIVVSTARCIGQLLVGAGLARGVQVRGYSRRCFRMGYRIQLRLVRQLLHVHVSLQRRLGIFTLFLREGGPGPELTETFG